ncbi:MAG: undecaprenyl-diphosphatase [Legionellales bacterium]|nr:undecaprenyl-diphosphatase [Legionellales bacterium]
MIEIFQAGVIGLIQGLTEFLPVSSSAHLILIPALLGWPEQGLAFDIVVHVATLLAVVWHYRHDCFKIASALFQSTPSPNRRLSWWLSFSPLPLVVLTLALGSELIHELRTPTVIAWSCIFFSLPLILAQYLHSRRQAPHASEAPWWILIVIALAQALAVIPGASRSGITLAAGVCCGLSLPQATRYAFLMAIPTIVLAFGYELIHLSGTLDMHLPSLLTGFIIAFLVALLCIRAFCYGVSKIGLYPFIVYRVLLGGIILMLL